jgi:hypothetical protein
LKTSDANATAATVIMEIIMAMVGTMTTTTTTINTKNGILTANQYPSILSKVLRKDTVFIQFLPELRVAADNEKFAVFILQEMDSTSVKILSFLWE